MKRTLLIRSIHDAAESIGLQHCQHDGTKSEGTAYQFDIDRANDCNMWG